MGVGLGRRARQASGWLAVFVVAGTMVGVLPGRTADVVPETRASSSGTPPANLLTGDQASFSASTGGWVGTEATLSWSSTVGDSAPGALSVTATGGEGMTAASGSPSAGGLVSGTAGFSYAGAGAAESASTAQGIEPVLTFYGASGGIIASVFGPVTDAVTSSWTELAPVSAIAPSGTTSVALFLDVPATSVGDEVYFDDAWVEGATGATASVVGPLHTSSNQILDANGDQVTLRGMVLDGLESSSTAPEITEQTVIAAKAWGANFLRVPLGEQFWLSTNCDYDPDYASRVDQVVGWIASLGMVALLDLHFNTVGTCETGGPHNMADAVQAPTFWSQVAARYAANPLVAFDLYNEPHDISDAIWLNGGSTTDVYGGQSYQAAGMQQLYDSVRSTGAQNLVFVSGNNYANSVPAMLVSGTNIVYGAHVYTCPNSAPPSCSDPNPYDPSPILDNWVGVSSSVPVMVTEFGWPSQYDGTYAAAVIAFAKAHGWGWSVFDWQQLQYATVWDVTDAWLSDGTAEPSPSGMPALCALVQGSSDTEFCVPPAPSPSPPPGSPSVTRVYGEDAEGTAVAQFEDTYRVADGCRAPGSSDPVGSVILAQDGYFSDALAGSFLAGELGTGILLTSSSSLSTETLQAIAEEGVKSVYVLGGALAVSPSVTDQLASTPATGCGATPGSGDLTVTRIAGATADDTAADIASACTGSSQLHVQCPYQVGAVDLSALYGSDPYNDTTGMSSADASGAGALPSAIVASDAGFQDADAASALADSDHLPVMITSPSSLSSQVPPAISSLGVRQVLLVGGPDAVSDGVVSSLESLGVSVIRVAGQDYTDTAQLLARLELSSSPGAGLSWNDGDNICVARGDYFADSLGAGSFCASEPGNGVKVPVVFTLDSDTVGRYLTAFLSSRGNGGGVGNLFVFGGDLAITNQTVQEMQSAAAG